jgi:hypothetical protein
MYFTDWKTAAGTISQMVKLLSEAAEDARINKTTMSILAPLWNSREFWDQIICVLRGTHKIVAKSPQGIVMAHQLHSEVRWAALEQINDQETLKEFAQNLGLDKFLRRRAATKIRDEHFVATLGGDVAIERIPTMNDITALIKLCTNTKSPSTLRVIARRIYQLSPEFATQRLQEVPLSGAHYLVYELTSAEELDVALTHTTERVVQEHIRHRLAKMRGYSSY